MNKFLMVTYNHSGWWDLDELELDLTKVNAWNIDNDTLHVQKVKDGLWERYEGNSELDDAYFDSIRDIRYEDGDQTVHLDNGQTLPTPIPPKFLDD